MGYSPLGHANTSHGSHHWLYTEDSNLNVSSSELLPESKPMLPTAYNLLDLPLKVLLTPHHKLVSKLISLELPSWSSG